MKKIRNALIFSALGQYSVQIISFALIIALARILTPAEIGVYAIAGAVSILAMELRSLGVPQFIVREENLDDTLVRQALGMTVMVSWGLGAFIAVTAPLVADFYNEMALTNILWIMSLSFLIAPFTCIPMALLKREMEFGPVFIQQFVGAVVNAGSTITLVLLGYSYYGLAWGVLIGMIAELFVGIYYQPPGTPWIPSFTWLGKLVKFGFFTSTAQMVTRFSESIPDLVIGRFATMTDVGLFSRGLGTVLFLNRIIVSAVSAVILPHLSEVLRSGGSIEKEYLRAIKLQAAFTWPIFAVVNVAAFPMINALFGDQWDHAAALASVLAIWSMFASIHCFAPSALIASGDEKSLFITSVVVFVFRLALVIVAAPYGLIAVSWAMVVSGVIEFIAMSVAIKRTIGLDFTQFFVAFIPNFIVTILCWSVAVGLDYLLSFETANPWQSIAYLAVIMPIIWLLSLRLTKHEAWGLALSFFRKTIPNNVR